MIHQSPTPDCVGGLLFPTINAGVRLLSGTHGNKIAIMRCLLCVSLLYIFYIYTYIYIYIIYILCIYIPVCLFEVLHILIIFFPLSVCGDIDDDDFSKMTSVCACVLSVCLCA